jgi:hypothetical protein
MQLFQCQSCGQVLYFENTACVKCGHRLGYLPDRGRMSAVEPDGAEWIALANRQARYRFCANWEEYACNWMVDAAQDQPFCIACQHNRTIPDLSLPENRANWQKIEEAKRRLFYTLIKLRLPMPSIASGDPEPLVFDFPASGNGEKVMTGHDNGVITIALEEADDVARERTRASLGELYRTLLGHFRHEVGHYYWDRLVRDGGETTAFALCSAMKRSITAKLCNAITTRALRQAGSRISSAPMPRCIRGRIGPRPGRITCTSSTRWRWRGPSASGSSRASITIPNWRPRSPSIRIRMCRSSG